MFAGFAKKDSPGEILVKLLRNSFDCIQMSRAPSPVARSFMLTIDLLLLVPPVISNQMINPARLSRKIMNLWMTFH